MSRPARYQSSQEIDAEAKALREAIDRMGGFSGAARKIGVSRQAILLWTQSQVPASRVLQVENLSLVPRERLRPDLYPSE
jgi:DNA-binding transcriptional regulator YdaS (Cro superfamily)